MGSIDRLIENITKLDIPEIIKNSIQDNEERVIEIQQKQLLHGRNSKGEIIGEYSNEIYADYKNKLNPAPGYGIVDLKLTGSFHNKLFIEDINKVMFSIYSSDQKTPELLKNYGDESLGLDQESSIELVDDVVRPYTVEKSTAQILK